MADCSWNSTVSQFGFAAMMGAAEPYSRRRIAYKVGPERYSFARLEREYGTADASCKAAFRFHLRDLRRLHAAMHFPDVIDTGHETVPGEEAFLIMLKRPAACQKSRLVAPQLSSCASPVCTWRLRAAQHSQTCGPRRWSPVDAWPCPPRIEATSLVARAPATAVSILCHQVLPILPHLQILRGRVDGARAHCAGSSMRRRTSCTACSSTCGTSGRWRLGLRTLNVLPKRFIEAAGGREGPAGSTRCR